MGRVTAIVLVGVTAWSLAYCSIKCPDGNVCSDHSTCCESHTGYECCQYPKAVCCSDLTHCCPEGFSCDLASQMCEKEFQPWMNAPMMKKVATVKEAAVPLLPISPVRERNNDVAAVVGGQAERGESSVVRCDLYHYCPDGTTCCKHPTGVWFCCPYSFGRCCLDGYHCCPFGYHCDLTYTHCVRQGVMYPFLHKTSAPAYKISTMEEKVALQEDTGARTVKEAAVPLLPISPVRERNNDVAAVVGGQAERGESSVVRCDLYHYCPDGTTCCKHPTGVWFCCPYSFGRCCLDGYHCCPFGYHCDLTYTHCVRQGVMYPFLHKTSTPAYKISTMEEKVALQETPMTPLTEAISGASEPEVIRCDDSFYCPLGRSCCKGSTGKWTCCPYPLGQCCQDGMHCCQYGYKCGPKSLTCIKKVGYSQISSGPQEPAKQD